MMNGRLNHPAELENVSVRGIQPTCGLQISNGRHSSDQKVSNNSGPHCDDDWRRSAYH